MKPNIPRPNSDTGAKRPVSAIPKTKSKIDNNLIIQSKELLTTTSYGKLLRKNSGSSKTVRISTTEREEAKPNAINQISFQLSTSPQYRFAQAPIGKTNASAKFWSDSNENNPSLSANPFVSSTAKRY